MSARCQPRFSTDDDCALLPADPALDSPMEASQSSYNGYFRHRMSQAQIPHMTRLESSISIQSLSAGTPHLEERMRRRLKYFFMNPCQKYQAKRRKPYKLFLQILKIVIVTAQLTLFGESNLALSNFKLENNEVFQASFLGHNRTYYTKSSVYSQVNEIRKQYAIWKNNTVGIFSYPPTPPGNISADIAPPVVMCVTSYDSISEKSPSTSLDFDLDKRSTECFNLEKWVKMNDTEVEIAKKIVRDDYIPLSNGTSYYIDFPRLITLDVAIGFLVVQINTPRGFTPPICFNTTILITLDNAAHNGVLFPNLVSQYHMIPCSKDETPSINTMKIFLNLFDSIIVLVCAVSMILCLRSLWKAQILRMRFETFFKAQYNKKLNMSDKLEFFNMWYLLIIISDVLTILGSLSKIVLQNKYLGLVDYNVCSVFLGVGCLCVWIGVLRYAGFFHQYNVLVLTLKKSLPHVCRFMVCASLLYLGFMFCGWVVLGPHHHKFRSLVVTSEALFSLINGDDMYMTFEEMSKTSTAMVVFSQIYLYVFIALFIYVVLSLFIAVIMDTYETIKDWQDQTQQDQSELEKFVAPCTADASVENYGFDTLNSATMCCWCCFGNNEEDIGTDDELLDD
uniref:mucolipin-3-like n=1 Tax=Styela clava TaxID=7725 RepID=UPI0019395417|nr:mucolipin-3-like [Styela clava]